MHMGSAIPDLNPGVQKICYGPVVLLGTTAATYKNYILSVSGIRHLVLFLFTGALVRPSKRTASLYSRLKASYAIWPLDSYRRFYVKYLGSFWIRELMVSCGLAGPKQKLEPKVSHRHQRPTGAGEAVQEAMFAVQAFSGAMILFFGPPKLYFVLNVLVLVVILVLAVVVVVVVVAVVDMVMVVVVVMVLIHHTLCVLLGAVEHLTSGDNIELKDGVVLGGVFVLRSTLLAELHVHELLCCHLLLHLGEDVDALRDPEHSESSSVAWLQQRCPAHDLLVGRVALGEDAGKEMQKERGDRLLGGCFFGHREGTSWADVEHHPGVGRSPMETPKVDMTVVYNPHQPPPTHTPTAPHPSPKQSPASTQHNIEQAVTIRPEDINSLQFRKLHWNLVCYHEATLLSDTFYLIRDSGEEDREDKSDKKNKSGALRDLLMGAAVLAKAAKDKAVVGGEEAMLAMIAIMRRLTSMSSGMSRSLKRLFIKKGKGKTISTTPGELLWDHFQCLGDMCGDFVRFQERGLPFKTFDRDTEELLLSKKEEGTNRYSLRSFDVDLCRSLATTPLPPPPP
ncbi:hypothetical protein BDK51DRAFT_26007 [Blyttiomyces helicus]|uniref:Uncharacterized protein n=1 Tax=Blyttiomyces helicus TaxID=388810 RepID=A0A4P9WDT3_9FUNG|nr:hypothetical protein BDK51DRAFT_26007 [Blyttiomyces helicus]|eukprot:RKO89905.1 hypothetical protein BDK51DRAFT_26007 [Blyttiomyces helicus]